jgi:hypothetical protein
MSRALKIEVWVYRIVAVIIVGVLLFASNNSKAGVFHSGNTLVALCTDDSQVRTAACLGYMQGSLDMMEGGMACTPDTITAGQARDIFLKAMREAPELRHKRADHLMMVIFGALYPCKTGTNAPQARPAI